MTRLRHEVRTPLNHIIGYSEMLLEDAGEGTGFAPELHRIHDQARRLLDLINDLLAPSKIEAGTVDLASAAARLSEPLQQIIATCELLRARTPVAGAVEILPDVERISLAARRLEALIGEWSLPLSGRRAAGPEGRVAGPVPAEAPAGRCDILIVDDDENNREMVARRLARDGYVVEVTASGQQALAVLLTRPVDLVLLDVMMPAMSGYEVLQRLKSEPALRDIPVLMISALDEVDSVARCIELGADDYLPKPFDPVLLRARIGACLEKKRLRDQEVRHLRELAEWNRNLEERVREQVAQVERLGRLKRFFSPQLAELILAGDADDPLTTHRREITVVFLDLRGFTSFAETSEPEEVMGVLRDYHAEMGKLIVEHEGTLERFAGDGMMVFFNDPVVVSNPAERAVRMAMAMRDRARELRRKWAKLGYELDLGVGIASGYATIGAIGFEGRWDYGAIGTVTNLASRLCGEAQSGQILIPQRLLAAVENLVEAESLGDLSLKGFLKPVHAFNVSRLKKPASGYGNPSAGVEGGPAL
jgi:class 3 adenylate cyclase